MHWCKFILICVAFLASANGVKVSLSVDKPQVEVGERVTFTCEVEDLAAGQFLRWQRILPGFPAINLATNYFLEPDFKENGRFATTGPSDQATDVFIFSFTINRAIEGDSGGFLCGVLGGDEMVFEQRNLTVIQDVTEETFSFTRLEAEEPMEVIDGEEVKYSAGDPLLVTCSVTKVYPTPNVKLTLGGEEIMDEALEEHKKDSDFQVVDEQLGVVEQWVTVTKTYRTMVTYEMAGKSLSCSGMLPGRSGTARGFTIGMDEVPPKISCPSEVIVEEWSSDQRLTCNVTARPAIKSFRVRYHIQNKVEDSNEELLVYGEANDGGDYVLELNEDGSQVSLVFSQVFGQHFRTYTFIVENAAGQSSADVVFSRDPNQSIVSGAASIVPMTTVLLMVALITQLLH